MINTRIRDFREQLINLVNEYEDIPIEAQYMALQLVTNKVTELANDAIYKEMEDEQCKNPIQE